MDDRTDKKSLELFADILWFRRWRLS